jgi:hypothetical protein
MKREVCKSFSGSFAALAYAYAAYAVATSRGIINEPVFLGRRWGVGYMDWIAKPQTPLQKPRLPR